MQVGSSCTAMSPPSSHSATSVTSSNFSNLRKRQDDDNLPPRLPYPPVHALAHIHPWGRRRHWRMRRVASSSWAGSATTPARDEGKSENGKFRSPSPKKVAGNYLDFFGIPRRSRIISNSVGYFEFSNMTASLWIFSKSLEGLAGLN